MLKVTQKLHTKNQCSQGSDLIGCFSRVTIETKWAALELMLGTSSSVVALAKKMAKPEIKTVTRTVAVPKTKIVKQEPQQQTTPKDTERRDFTPIRPQPPLPNQQDDRDKR